MDLSFASRLRARLARFGALCVGIDPSSAILKAAGLPDRAEGALALGERILAAANYDLAIVKPQVAFFERFGAEGFKALEELTVAARAREILVLADAKRGDIDSTADAYGEAWFGARALRADALTVHAYLGLEALRGLISRAVSADAGVFVVVRSSNPEGEALQLARGSDGRRVADRLADAITEWNARLAPEGPGPLGAVVGATCVDAPEIVDRLPRSYVLAPGVGAQGASFVDVATRFAGAVDRVLPNVSRAVLANGGSQADIRSAIRALIDDCDRALGRPRSRLQ
jgi:orotidine-5'-phosphate decarboxylase